MKRIALASILTVFLACTLAFCAGTVSAQEGWEKTVTLPSGEKVLDMRGEWDVLFEFYGWVDWLKPESDMLLITQEGNTFSAVQQIGIKWTGTPKGTEKFKGKLDKDGFKEVQLYRLDMTHKLVWVPCQGEISEHGNKVVFDDGDSVKATLTRR